MLRKFTIAILFFCCALPQLAAAQAIDNTLSYKNISSDRYFRVNYENDFFASTDRYYTQGIHFELVTPALKNFPLTWLLLHPRNSAFRYGIGLEHEGYTPTSISNPDIIHGDRPFAACFFLKTFLIATDSESRQRISTSLSTGVIGPAAGGGEMQTAIHRWTGSITPHGWHNQIHNDLIANYEVQYEKQLVRAGNYFSLSGNATGRVGTLSDMAGIGANLMGGYFDSPFGGMAAPGRFKIYAYEHAGVNVTPYDATLQGGVFNHSSPYVLASGDITKVTFQNRFGFVVNIQNIYLEYFQSFVSSEFKNEDYHVWGGLQVAVKF